MSTFGSVADQLGQQIATFDYLLALTTLKFISDFSVVTKSKQSTDGDSPD